MEERSEPCLLGGTHLVRILQCGLHREQVDLHGCEIGRGIGSLHCAQVFLEELLCDASEITPDKSKVY